jgi:tetratricopeptide (TPR) repeat protein
MSLDQEAITQQLTFLATHRRTLAHLLQQAAQYGGEVFAPPQTANGIAEARQQIRRIKAILRKNGVQLDDVPNDKAPRRRKPAQLQQPGDVISGDKVGGDKIAGDKVSITNISPNQGAQGVFHGSVNIQLPPPPSPPTLHQLRAPIGDFVGREREIEMLVQVLSKAASGGASAAISGVRGMGGIGKTELAYTVAQRLAGHLPDAQLIVELRGASSSPLTPAQALHQVIRSFEREAQLPDELSQLQTLYRSGLSGKRALILADDALDAAQVRPLLPPQGCALLVTSRQRFSLPGMAMIDLGTLPPEDAERLLLEICPRIGEHASELAKLCGELPLALRISASLLANSSRNVARYLEQLAAERLKYLSDPDDPQARVEASLHVSYDTLAPQAQQALCQISVFAASFDLAAAQAVAAIDGDVAEALELLQRRSLLEWDATVERFSLHDLVRAFAAARLENADAVRVRHARYYVRVAESAQQLYLRGDKALLDGLALFDREFVHIDTGWRWALEQAGSQEADGLLLDYTNASAYLCSLWYNERDERIPRLEAAVAAARRLGQRADEGTALGNLGVGFRRLGELARAIEYHEQALAIMRAIGDRRQEGWILVNLGRVFSEMGEAERAIEYHEQALAIMRAIGDRRQEGKVLGNLGTAYSVLKKYQQAIDYDAQWLSLARQIGDQHGEGHALSILGKAYSEMSQVECAIDYYEQALAIMHSIGDRPSAALISWGLGQLLERQGDLARAAELMQVNMSYLREIGHPDAEKRAARLEQLRQHLAASQNSAPADAPDEA